MFHCVRYLWHRLYYSTSRDGTLMEFSGFHGALSGLGTIRQSAVRSAGHPVDLTGRRTHGNSKPWNNTRKGELLGWEIRNFGKASGKDFRGVEYPLQGIYATFNHSRSSWRVSTTPLENSLSSFENPTCGLVLKAFSNCNLRRSSCSSSSFVILLLHLL